MNFCSTLLEAQFELHRGATAPRSYTMRAVTQTAGSISLRGAGTVRLDKPEIWVGKVGQHR